MLVNIQSMKGSINDYKDMLSNKLDFDKHYQVLNVYIIAGPYADQVVVADCLKDVEVSSIEEMFKIFDKFEEGMGESYGHITVNVKTGDIMILDSWIE